MTVRALLPFAILWLPGAMAAQPGPLNQVDGKGRKQGPWSKTWESTGKVRYEGSFQDDRPIGSFLHYDEDGKLISFALHHADGRSSRAEHYHANGRKMAEGKYLGREKDSTWTYYTAEGQVRQVEHFANGRLHGERVTFHNNGQLAERTHFQNGLQHGDHATWYPSGARQEEGRYLNGRPDGRFTHYHPNGRKEMEGKYADGAREGSWFHFLPDGRPHVTLVYRQGAVTLERRENGVFTTTWDGERPRREETWKEGKLDGPFTEYHDSGQWVVRRVPADPVSGAPAFEERVLQGHLKAREGAYRNGLLHGEVREYDEKGRQLKVRRFVEGMEQ